MWSCNFNNINNFVTLASTGLRLPEYDADAVKHVGMLTINKILLIYIYIYMCVVHLLVGIINHKEHLIGKKINCCMQRLGLLCNE